MYAQGNPRTKTELKRRIAEGEKIRAFQPAAWMALGEVSTGWITLEGPHYPEPHKWQARARVENGIIVHVK